MSKVAQLKKKAAEFELKKQFDKALALYVEILDGYERNPEEVDVSLFNRVGDLMLRQGSVADAIDYYERAVDLYAEGGFFNNAIALCNKILRQSPGRAIVYYKLGKISAQKGFKSDAKRNFLEYADRMQKAGRMDEAFRALKEFADLCPDQDDIRLMLAEQLSKAERTGEAIDQLQTLYERYAESGRDVEARATIDRMRAIDPTVTPRGTGGPMRAQRGADLVFLDLDAPASRTGDMHTITSGTPIPPPEDIGPIERGVIDEVEPLAIEGLATSNEFERIEVADAPTLEGVARQTPFTVEQQESLSTDSLSGFEQTAFGAPATPTPDAAPALLDFEPTSFGAGELHVPPVAGLDAGAPPPVEIEPSVLDAVTDAGLDLDLSTLRAASGAQDAIAGPGAELRDDDAPLGAGPDLEFLYDGDGDRAPSRPTADLPTLDLGDESLEGTESLDDWRGPREREAHNPTPHAAVDGLPLMDLDVASVRMPAQSAVPSRPSLDSAALDLTLSTGTTPEDIRAITAATPSHVRKHTAEVERTLEERRAAVEGAPADGARRRELGEALLETGHREEGLEELERAMTAFERAEDLEGAASVADELVRANPTAVRLHQKRVEYAFRTNDKPRLVEAYLSLAASLLQSGQTEKSRAVYQRVLDLKPDEPRALAALSAFATPEPAPPPPQPMFGGGRSTRDNLGAARGPTAPVKSNDFINLGDMLRDEPAEKNTRMVVGEHEPTGDEEADFADMLRKFKQGIAENVGDEDHQSHYDLGIAFKEMGLVDEAVAEFQKALRAPTNRVPTYEALGQCFVEKGQFQLAATVLGRALSEKGVSDDALIGVLYLLGRAAEELGRFGEALDYYQRVFVLDITFRDVARRIGDVEQQARR